MTQPGITQARPQAPFIALSGFAVEQQGEPFGMREIGVLGADSGEVARSFRDHVARCSDMMSPA